MSEQTKERPGDSRTRAAAARKREAKVSAGEIRGAIDLIGKDEVRHAVEIPHLTYPRLVNAATGCEAGRERDAYVALAASDYDAVRRIVGLPTYAERRMRRAIWERHRQGVAGAEIAAAVEALGFEEVVEAIEKLRGIRGRLRELAMAHKGEGAGEAWLALAAADLDEVRQAVGLSPVAESIVWGGITKRRHTGVEREEFRKALATVGPPSAVGAVLDGPVPFRRACAERAIECEGEEREAWICLAACSPERVRSAVLHGEGTLVVDGERTHMSVPLAFETAGAVLGIGPRA